jgi:hypothetical protein
MPKQIFIRKLVEYGVGDHPDDVELAVDAAVLVLNAAAAAEYEANEFTDTPTEANLRAAVKHLRGLLK